MGFLRNLFGKKRVTPEHSGQGRLQEISTSYAKMLLAQGQKVNESTIASYMLKIREGLQAESQRDLQKAIGCYTDAINLVPQLPDAYYWRGDLFGLPIRQSQSALDDMNKVIELIESLNCRALLTEFMQGRTKESILSHAYVVRGGAHNDLGNTEQGLKDFENSERLESA